MNHAIPSGHTFYEVVSVHDPLMLPQFVSPGLLLAAPAPFYVYLQPLAGTRQRSSLSTCRCFVSLLPNDSVPAGLVCVQALHVSPLMRHNEILDEEI